MKNTVKYLTLCLCVVGISMVSVFVSHGAVLSGSISGSPSNTADFGWTLGVNPLQFNQYSVRIEGTDLSAPVTDSATFEFANAPTGALNLVLEEPDEHDVFTHETKKIQVDVIADPTTNTDFFLNYHWAEIGYHTNWGNNGYGEWTPHFVSDQVGFIYHRVRGAGIDPERMELYRTLNGGSNWTEIGHWLITTNYPRPSLSREFFFTDADHGVVLATVSEAPFGASGRGFFYTSDGGANWNYIALPRPPDAYGIGIQRFAKISTSHIIAAGTVGGAVQGYGGKYYDAIWESTDSGASWSLKISWEQMYGGCTALDAIANGKAIAFYTPYSVGAEQRIARRDTGGNWTVTNTWLEVNAGYGPADVPMVGDEAWIYNSSGTSNGFYKTTDAGATWTKISGSAPQYMDFVSTRRGFIVAGGPSYATYNGGITWHKQAGGGGLCCHGNDIWAFDERHAVWHEGGAGDPNGKGQIFSYVEPEAANFEIYRVSPDEDQRVHAWSGENGVLAARYRARNWGTVPVVISNIIVHAQGSANDANDVTALRLVHDADADGVLDSTDPALDTQTYAADNGAATFKFNQTLYPGVDIYYLLILDVAGSTDAADTFRFSFTSSDVAASRLDNGQSLAMSAPAAVPCLSPIVEVQNSLFTADFETQTNKWDFNASYTNNTWGLSSSVYASSDTSACIAGLWEYGESRCLTLTNDVIVGANDTAYLSFFHEYYFNNNMNYCMIGYVEVSVNGGYWQQVKQYYPSSGSISSEGCVQEILSLDSYIPATGGVVRVRFRVYQGQGWGRSLPVADCGSSKFSLYSRF